MLLTSSRNLAASGERGVSLTLALSVCPPLSALQTEVNSEVLVERERSIACERTEEQERTASQARKRKKWRRKKKTSTTSFFHSVILLELPRSEPSFFPAPALLTSPAMILSFYLPAMVFIVLTALATCVFRWKKSWRENEGRERGNASGMVFRFDASAFFSRPKQRKTPALEKKNITASAPTPRRASRSTRGPSCSWPGSPRRRSSLWCPWTSGRRSRRRRGAEEGEEEEEEATEGGEDSSGRSPASPPLPPPRRPPLLLPLLMPPLPPPPLPPRPPSRPCGRPPTGPRRS